MNFTGILIGSENPGRLAEFYTKVLGKAGYEDGGYVGWQIGNGFVTIGPHDQVHGPNAEPGRIIWNIESEDVAGDFESFKAAGATVVAEPYHPGDVAEAWIATFADPDGNYFQLMSPMPM